MVIAGLIISDHLLLDAFLRHSQINMDNAILFWCRGKYRKLYRIKRCSGITVRNIGEDARRFKLLRGTVNLSRELGLKIVVEGVETKDQLALINSHRCADYIQGYVFSMPISSEAVITLADTVSRKRAARKRQSVA